jgi:hypothetical protein
MESASVRTERSHLRFEDGGVTVTSSERGDLGWLSDFLACGFEEASASDCDRSVVLRVDAAGYDRLLASGRPGSGVRVEGFARDSAPVLLERWPSNGSTSVFRDPRRPIFYVVSENGARIEILARERGPKCRTTLMRVVRELTMDRVVATGGVLVHGAAIRVDGGVIAICGPKRSGKTTLLMALLMTPGTRYVANARCALRANGAGVSVRGLPTIVSIRRDGLERFPAARQRLSAVRPDLAGHEQPDRPNFSLSPPEFCALMNDCPRASGGPLLALIHPRITDDPTRLSLHRLDADEALERFRQGLFRAAHASPLGEAFASAAAREASFERESQRRIVESIPSFDVRLGAGGAPGTPECRDLLARIAKARSEARRP